MNRKIFKTGHSAAVTVSSAILKQMGLKVGDNVNVEYNKETKEVIIRPGGKASHQLGLNLKIRPKM